MILHNIFCGFAILWIWVYPKYEDPYIVGTWHINQWPRRYRFEPVTSGSGAAWLAGAGALG